MNCWEWRYNVLLWEPLGSTALKQLHKNIASTDESEKDEKVKTKSSSKNKTRFKPTGTQKIQPIPSHFKSLQDSHKSLGYGNDLPLAEHLVFL